MFVDESNSNIESQPLEADASSITPVTDSVGNSSPSVGAGSNEKTEKMPTGELLGKEEVIYTKRFTSEEDRVRKATWKILVRDFFQRYIKPDSVVVDLGAGDGNFIRNIRAKRRIAVDLSPHVLLLAGKNADKNGLEGKSRIEVIQAPATELSAHVTGVADVIFMSNFLEHLPTKQVLLDVLAECHKALGKNGKLLILQPNIRYVGPAYWDYIDHHIALTEHSLVEALTISGFSIQRLIPQFLPYTAKSKLGLASRGRLGIYLVKWYLKLPFLWRIFGQQTFVVARKE
jgi:SAM-dependent methyltransferase